ncbi:MAG: SAM-dependent methyltransferase [Rubrivivax sp.]
MSTVEPVSLSARLSAVIAQAIRSQGGWLPFDRFMAMALYEPGLGYYANPSRKFGTMPASGSDFVTAPEMSALFGQSLSVQLLEALDRTETDSLWEFGAGSGALAAQLLLCLGQRVREYHIVELSATLRQRQMQALAAWGDRVTWHEQWPSQMRGVVVGNEVLDAMPVQLLRWSGSGWQERGVGEHKGRFAWQDRDTTLHPPVATSFEPGSIVEIHAQAEAFVRTLASHLRRGAAFFIDYGFPEQEYYHPQRVGGTLMCHRAHLVDDNPLVDVGLKDITAHVNFSGLALAAQEAGLAVLGYTSQARFLFNCGIAGALQRAGLRDRTAALRLINEHEMGELFKVIGLVKGEPFEASGFAQGDRSHRL